jgi:2-keto-3-deoxy-L-rhamnonate aldolase RhmA
VRGFGPRRGLRYGATSISDYLKTADRQTLVFVQLEHLDALRNLEQIIDTPGVDGACVGPNDLSGSMGKLGQTTDPQVRQQVARIISTARRMGKLAGLATGFDPASFRVWLDSGVHWVCAGGDWHYLFAHGRALIEAARGVEAERSRSQVIAREPAT